MSHKPNDPAWTPGPHRYEFDTEHIIASDGSGHIATVQPKDGPLFALAPEMAEALLDYDPPEGAWSMALLAVRDKLRGISHDA